MVSVGAGVWVCGWVGARVSVRVCMRVWVDVWVCVRVRGLCVTLQLAASKREWYDEPWRSTGVEWNGIDARSKQQLI